MSKHDIVIQMLKGIEQTLAQLALVHDLVHKDVLNTREAALYLGRSVNALYKLRSRCKLPGYKPSNGKLYFYKVELFDWMLSNSDAPVPQMLPESAQEVEAMASTGEEEESPDEEEEDEEAKMAIFNQEGG